MPDDVPAKSENISILCSMRGLPQRPAAALCGDSCADPGSRGMA